jgi:hypothetical protein
VIIFFSLSVHAPHGMSSASYAPVRAHYQDTTEKQEEYNPYEAPPLHHDGSYDGTRADVRRSRSRSNNPLGYYPLSTIVVVVWAIFIAVTLWLLELASKRASQSITQPWYITVLPSIFLTVFAQAHGAITAMHLARLGVSALQSPRLAPRTWIELFWMADGNYQGPAGLATVILGMLKAKTFVSSTFVLFSLTCILALVTPIVFSRAYPVSIVDVQQAVPFTPNTLSPARLAAIDAYGQMAIGSGAWTSGLSVADIYNKSVFTPIGSKRNESDTGNFFFASDVSGLDVVLPGVRVQGSCVTVDDSPLNAATSPVSPAQVCQTGFPDLDADEPSGGNITITPNVGELDISAMYCTNSAFGSSWVDASNSTGVSSFIWFNLTNGTEPRADGPRPVATLGLVHCSAKVTTGTALLNGRQGTFEAFNESTIYNISQSQGGEPLLHPIFAPLWSLDTTPSTDEANAAALAMLGYKANFAGVGSSVTWDQPSLTQLADEMWKAAAHMAAAVSIAARASDHNFTAIQHVSVSGRTRNDTLAVTSLGLLGMWAAMLLYCTLRMFRATFGDSLASYVPARLVLDQPEVVGAERSGQLGDNILLRRRFGYVDRTSAQIVVPFS